MIPCLLYRSRVPISLLGAVCALTASASADVRLPHIVSSHMVLQRDVPVTIWGWADPDEAVTGVISLAHTG